ncbi:hypothetical protein HPB51_018107 [Rhipicephalus microplus]|uniref:Transmembrane protein n=1 Tax=Rhipicephalus microplus TaxID=6941 RepID=A0A9J6E2D1_RHIMP|nr:hypothetical protein HPB51_018107 [Rhipicephalus microplus]
MYYQRFQDDDAEATPPGTTGLAPVAAAEAVTAAAAPPGYPGYDAPSPDVAPSAAAFGFPVQGVAQQFSSQGTTSRIPAAPSSSNAADNVASRPTGRNRREEAVVPKFQDGSSSSRSRTGPSLSAVRSTRPYWLLCLSGVLVVACVVLGALVYVAVKKRKQQATLTPRATQQYATTEFDW